MPILDQYGKPISTSKKPDTREIAVVSVRDKYSTYPSNNLTPQRLATILKEADQGDIWRQMELFEEIEEKDTHIFSQLQIRKNSVLGCNWDIHPYSDDARDKEIAKFVGDVLYNLTDLEDAFLNLSDAVGKGTSVVEIMWAIENSSAVPVQLKWRHPKKFRYGDYDELRLLTESNISTGEELPPNKFIVHQYKAKSGSPARAGVLRVCAWMYLFKNFTVKDWVAFSEVYGMPLRVGKYDPGTSQEEKDILIQAVMMLGTDAAGVISKSTEIEFIEAIKADGDVFEKLANFCNREISKAILGQTLTSEVGSTGSYAASQTHEEVRQDLVEADAKALSKTLRRDLIQPLVYFNYGDAHRLPYLRFQVAKPSDSEKDAKTYSTLVNMGLKIASDHVYEKFGVPKPEANQELVILPMASPAANMGLTPAKLALLQAFASKGPGQNPPGMRQSQAIIDDLADRVLQEGIPVMDRLIAPLLEAIETSDDLETIRNALMQAYSEMDTSELEEYIARATYAADLFGRWTGDD